MNRSQDMSIYYCSGCDGLRDSDEEWMHDFGDSRYLCDKCMVHEEAMIESMDQLRKMAKMGEI